MDTSSTINRGMGIDFSGLDDEQIHWIRISRGDTTYITHPCPGTGGLHEPYIDSKVEIINIEGHAYVSCRNCDFRTFGYIDEQHLNAGDVDRGRAPADSYDPSQVQVMGRYDRDGPFELGYDDPDPPIDAVWWLPADNDSKRWPNLYIDHPVEWLNHDRPPLINPTGSDDHPVRFGDVVFPLV